LKASLEASQKASSIFSPPETCLEPGTSIFLPSWMKYCEILSRLLPEPWNWVTTVNFLLVSTVLPLP
jgi:hypothetical protein